MIGCLPSASTPHLTPIHPTHHGSPHYPSPFSIANTSPHHLRHMKIAVVKRGMAWKVASSPRGDGFRLLVFKKPRETVLLHEGMS